MRYPFSLFLDSAKYLAAHRLRGHRKFPLVLSLDPLGACSCKCGKNKGGPGTGRTSDGPSMLTVEQCLEAIEQCRSPIVLIRGGEPLEYPEMAQLAREILKRGKHLFLCTNGALIRRRLHMIPPETRFFWNVKLDGTETIHDARAGRPGLFVDAFDGVKAAKNAGFCVIVSTTVYPETDVLDVAELYQKLHAVHVDGYMLSPAYPGKAMCRDSCASFRKQMQQRFWELSELLGDYNLLISPPYLEYLRGERELDCCAWGSPVFGPQGWSAPCVQINKGHEKSYKALVENTAWENFGRGMNPRCETCMCQAGYEMAAVVGTSGKAADIWKMLAWQFQGTSGERRERARNS